MVVQDRRSPTQDMIRLIRIKILPSRVEVLPSKVKIPPILRRRLLQGNPGSQWQSYSHSYWVGQLRHGVSKSWIEWKGVKYRQYYYEAWAFLISWLKNLCWETLGNSRQLVIPDSYLIMQFCVWIASGICISVDDV